MTIQALREQRSAHAKTLRNLVDQHPGDKWGDTQQKQYDGLVADIDRLDAHIERTQRAFDLDAQNHAGLQHHADRAGVSVDEAAHEQAQERAVFMAWLRGGNTALS